MREVAAELERPVLLFSGGKDSIVLLRLAEKAFRPGEFPFPVMHVDTGHNFPEVIEFRDRRVEELGERLIVASVQESIDNGRVVEETGPRASRNRLQTVTLLDAIDEHGFDAAFGGARRDEERARAKERDLLLPRRLRPVGPQGPAPRAVEPLQRPHHAGRARARVPDLELDRARRLAVHRARRSIELPVDLLRPRARGLRARRDALRGAPTTSSCWPDEEPFEESVRYRTVGDMSCTGAVRVDRRDARRGRRRDRRHAHHRARRDARRRPLHRGRDGGPQARGLLLDAEAPCRQRHAAAAAPHVRAAALRHRRLGRRRQVHADRPAALRLQAIFEDQLEHVEETSQRARRRLRRTSRCSPTACAPSASRASRSTSPTATSRRRGASSSSPTRPATCSTRATWSPARRPPTSRSILVDARKGVRRAVAPPRVHRLAAAHPAPRRVRQQDGPRRLRRGGLRARSSPSSRASRPSSTCTTSPSSRSPRCTATTSSSARENMPWYEGPPLLYHLEHVHIASDRNLIDVRFPVQWVIRPMSDEHHDYRGYAGQVAGGVFRPATRSSCCPPGARTRIAGDRHARRASSTRRSRRCR